MAEPIWYDTLKQNLKDAQIETNEITVGAGRILVTTRGARLLAMLIPGCQTNAFWNNPALTNPNTTSEQVQAIANSAGGGFGGDRLWIAPEVGYIFTDLAQARISPTDHEALPPEMDPGNWTVITHGPGSISMSAPMKLLDHRSGKTIDLQVKRHCEAVGQPEGLPEGITHAGFSLRHTLTLVGGDDQAVAGAWSLLQVNPEGTLHCPTTINNPWVRSYYDPFGGKHVQTPVQQQPVEGLGQGVRFLIDGKHRIKMGLLAEHSTGRMAFYRPAKIVGDQEPAPSLVILRIYMPRPGDTYCDLPRDSDELLGGDALQAYNHIEGLGNLPGFGEMEYHDPAIVVGKGPAVRVGTSVTHVMVGEDSLLRSATQNLLGMPLEHLE